MATFRNRFPSRRDTLLVLTACAFPIHLWSILSVLRLIPSWAQHNSTWDIIGIVAYTQVFALFETLLLLVCLLLIGAILPARWFRARFVASSGLIVWVAASWTALFQLVRTADVLVLSLVLCPVCIVMPALSFTTAGSSSSVSCPRWTE